MLPVAGRGLRAQRRRGGARPGLPACHRGDAAHDHGATQKEGAPRPRGGRARACAWEVVDMTHACHSLRVPGSSFLTIEAGERGAQASPRGGRKQGVWAEKGTRSCGIPQEASTLGSTDSFFVVHSRCPPPWPCDSRHTPCAAQRMTHSAHHEIELQKTKKEREPRKAQYLPEAGGWKYTALAMAHRSREWRAVEVAGLWWRAVQRVWWMCRSRGMSQGNMRHVYHYCEGRWRWIEMEHTGTPRTPWESTAGHGLPFKILPSLDGATGPVFGPDDVVLAGLPSRPGARPVSLRCHGVLSRVCVLLRHGSLFSPRPRRRR